MKINAQDWVGQWVKYQAQEPAIKDYATGRCLNYGELNQAANHLAAQLVQYYGLLVGDRIAVLAEHCLEYVILFVAAQKAGFVIVPFNYRLTSSEIDYLLEDAKPQLVIDSIKYRHLLEQTPQFLEVAHHWPLEDLSLFCERALDETPIGFSPRPLDENAPIFILYTSGTTGFSKGAIYSHKMLFWNSINTAMSLVVNTESRTVNCMPPFHTGGWNVLLTPFLHHGAYTCLVEKFDPGLILELLEEEKVSIFMAVPTMLKMMAEHPNFEQTDLSHLKYIIVGGEAMPIPLIKTWHQKGVPIRQGYGMTEVGPNLTSLHQRDAIRKQGSIGFPNFYVETKIVDQAGEEVGDNSPGELLIKGPMVTPGYWQNEEASERAIKDDWFHTGDIAKRDEEGYLYIVDRIKNMFISGGENVYPVEVERILQAHPAIDQVAVIGVKDQQWGEVGKAFIIRSSSNDISVEQLKDYCQSKLAKFKVPKHFQFIDQLPQTDTGKIDRKALKGLSSSQT